MMDQIPWIYIFSMKEKIKEWFCGFFLITASNYVHGKQKFDSNGPFNSTDRSIIVTGS